MLFSLPAYTNNRMKPFVRIVILFVFLYGCVRPPLAVLTSSPALRPDTATPLVSQPALLRTSPAPSATPTPTLLPTPTSLALPEKLQTGQHPYEIDFDQVHLRFLLFLPLDYSAKSERKWPLILFLHGSGEAGDQINLVAATGLPERLLNDANFPFIVISPQLPAPHYPYTASSIDDYIIQFGWGRWIDHLEKLLDWLEIHLAVDSRREYLTGLSLGGFGTWEYAFRYPQRFAAIAPIAGGFPAALESPPHGICRLKDLPIWVFHGELDTSVSPAYSKVLVEALRECGGNPLFTLYPNEGHKGAWTRAYTSQALFDWMLSYQKNQTQ
jgi:predicted peptidase